VVPVNLQGLWWALYTAKYDSKMLLNVLHSFLVDYCSLGGECLGCCSDAWWLCCCCFDRKLRFTRNLETQQRCLITIKRIVTPSMFNFRPMSEAAAIGGFSLLI
jgi:hypothetical protein